MTQRRLLFLTVAVLLRYTAGQLTCSGCVCKTDDGTIDLTSLSGRGYASFSSIADPNKPEYTYSYNPCAGFTEGYGSCSYQDVSGCQELVGDEYTQFSLGDPDTETMVINDPDNDVYLQYDSGDEGRSMIVNLVCDPNAGGAGTITAEGDSAEPLTYVFHLTTKCACPGGCADDPLPPTTNPSRHTTDGSHKDGVSSGYVGIILIVLAIAGAITYFVAGIVINYVKLEKRGTDMIPQKYIWFAVPFLVKDGCIFTFGPLVNKIRNRSLSASYDKI